jgi:putative inorganic carbon (HCO3(-)) transporter
MSALRSRRLHEELPLAGVTGMLAGSVVFATAVLPPRWAMLGLVAIAGTVATAAVGDARRLLLAVVVLDVPLQWDMNFWYREDAAQLGALGGLNVSVTTVALIALYTLWWWERGPRGDGAPAPRWRPAAPLLAFVGVEALSLTVARDRSLGAYEVVMLVQTLALFVYVASTVRTHTDVRFLVTMLCGALLLEALIIVALAITGSSADVLGIGSHPDQRLAGAGGDVRLGGTIGSPNTAASFLGLLIPLALAHSLVPGPRAVRRLAAVAAGVGLVALIMTGSRGGWIGFAISFTILALGGGRLGLVRWRAVALAALLVALLAVPFASAISARVTRDDRGSAESRVSMAQLAWDMIEDHPLLGVGVNNVGLRIPDYRGPEFAGQFLYTIHNRYLLAWAEAGLAAALALVWFLLATLARAARAARAPDPLVAATGVAIGAAVTAQAVHMSVDIFQSRPQTQGLWLVAGLAAALVAMSGTVERR